MNRPRVSSKLEKFRPSLTLWLKELAQKRRSQGLPVYDFGLGETKGELAPHIASAAQEAYRTGKTTYGDPAGLQALRSEALKWVNLDNEYGIENVVITTGAKQSLFNIFLAVCEPGDVVLLDAAPWVSYQPMVLAAGASPIAVQPADPDSNRLKITGDDLRRELCNHPTTKIFLLNSPCNPTGQIYSPEELEELLAVCVENQVYLLLDRLYWRHVFDGKTYPEPPIDDHSQPWLIQVDGISKNFRRTGGIRIGWSVAPTDLTQAMINLQSHYTSGPSVPAQHAALAAISHPYDPELTEHLERVRDLLSKEAKLLPHVEVWPTAGAFYSFWDVRDCFGTRTPQGIVLNNSDDVAEYLLKSAGVVTASGRAFEQDGYLRLSFAIEESFAINGVRAAAKALSQLRISH